MLKRKELEESKTAAQEAEEFNASISADKKKKKINEQVEQDEKDRKQEAKDIKAKHSKTKEDFIERVNKYYRF